MTLHIRTITDVSSEELYTIIIDSLGELVGEGGEPWGTVPCIGEHCVVAVDRAGELTLIGFHPSEPWRALMAGLSSMDQLNNKLAAMLIKDYRKPARLIILSPAKPPGSETLAQFGLVTLRNFKVVEVNGERGLFLEEPLETSTGATDTSVEPRSGKAGEPGLTREEEDFFASV